MKATPAANEARQQAPEAGQQAPDTGARDRYPAARESELAGLAQGALLVVLRDHGRLLLSGADRLDFLHGQISNDVRGLAEGGMNRSLLLNHRGQALAEMQVLRGHDDIDLVVEGGAVEVVEDSLRRHIIFDQVELASQDSHTTLTLQGDEAKQLLAALVGAEPPEYGRHERVEIGGAAVIVSPVSRTGRLGYDLYLEEGAVEAVSEAVADGGAEIGSRSALEVARVSAGIPTVAGEAGAGVLPQEAGLEPLVSYRKGCYLGQEIMARIEARGKLRRELGGLILEGEPAADDREIRLEGKLVGRLGTVVRHPRLGLLALAVLRSDLPEGGPVEVAGVVARRAALPFA